MGTIISTGVGSGLDVQGLVQKLVAAEGAPKTARLDSAEAKAQAKISALGTVRSALASFRDALAKLKNLDRFQGRAVTLSTPDYFSASAGTSAVPASYTVHVEQLAQAHKLRTDPLNATDPVGTGTLTIAVGSESFDIEIDASNNTVAGIASAINTAAGAKVSATVIMGAGGQATLTLSARETGEANELTVTQSGGDGGLSVLEFSDGVGAMTQIAAAQDAHAEIDGVEVKSTTNTISGAIQGVDITLLATNEGDDTSTMTIGYDRAGARDAIDALVKGYNGVVDAIASVASYDVETRTGGPLFGDAGMSNLVQQLRRELGSTVAGVDASADMLAKIGVTVDLGGKLSVDDAKINAAFDANFDEIGKLFADEDAGIARRLDALLDPYLKSGGILDNRGSTLKSMIDDIADQREALNRRLEALHARYLEQFNALDTLLAQMQSTSTFLSQQLDNLPGATSTGKK